MNQPLKFKQTAGIDLKGVVSDAITGQPIETGDISLVIEKDSEMAFLTDTKKRVGGNRYYIKARRPELYREILGQENKPEQKVAWKDSK